MSNFTKRFRNRYGLQAEEACQGTNVTPAFLAGLASVENAWLDPSRSRFEPHVFRTLLTLRDKGSYVDGRGRRRFTYGRVQPQHLEGLSDAGIKNLASSWGLFQLMGYWGISLNCSVADLRDPAQQCKRAVQLLLLASKNELERGQLPSVLRIWNTGSPEGKTYHADYVPNAMRVMKEYESELWAGPTKVVEVVPIELAPKDDTGD